MTSKTSQNSPLQIAQVQLEPDKGSLGLTLCPGKKDPGSHWNRDLAQDLQAIRDWGATTVVTLIEDHEFEMLGVQTLGQDVRALGLAWVHLPILDVSIPDHRFEDAWLLEGPKLHKRLDAGERVLIHCRGGLGRTGLVAGRILVERGCEPQIAMQRIRAVRPHAIETRAQERYVLGSKSLPGNKSRWKKAMVYRFDSPRPGEQFEEYLMRHNAHPSQKDRRQATPEEEALLDVTDRHVGNGFIIQTGK